MLAVGCVVTITGGQTSPSTCNSALSRAKEVQYRPLKSLRTEPLVLFRCGRGTVEVRLRYGRGTVEVRSRCVRYSLGTLPVHSWYGILKIRSRLVFSTRLEPGTRTVCFIVRIAQSRLAGFGSATDTIPLIRNVESSKVPLME